MQSKTEVSGVPLILNSLKSKIGDIKGKKVLDVGTRTGQNANEMRKMGADVFVCDPDSSSLDYAISQGFVEKHKAFHVELQDIPSDLKGSFDIATVFLYNIPFAKRENFARSLSESIKENGTVIVSIYDRFLADVIVNPHGIKIKNTAAVGPLLNKYFHSVSKVNIGARDIHNEAWDMNIEVWNRCFFTCSGPKYRAKVSVESKEPKTDIQQSITSTHVSALKLASGRNSEHNNPEVSERCKPKSNKSIISYFCCH